MNPGNDRETEAEGAEILRRLAEALRKRERAVPRPHGEQGTAGTCEWCAQCTIPPEAGIAAITLNEKLVRSPLQRPAMVWPRGAGGHISST